MFVLNSDITIGEYKQVKPIEVRVKKTVYEYVETAVIKLPISARIKRAGEVITSLIDTAKLIEEGMKVNIQLGYNGSLKTEFVGFVSRVNLTSPCEVMCEGYSYQLRKRTYVKTFKNAELLEVLMYLVEGTDIVLDKDNIPSFPIEKLMLNGCSGTEALEEIKKISKNSIRFFFTGNVLFGGCLFIDQIGKLSYVVKADVKYKLGWNVIKDGDLKLRQAKNDDVVVNWIGEKKDGTTEKVTVKGKTKIEAIVIKTSASSGTTGETKNYKSYNITDKSSLQQMADAKHQALTYDGYEGKISTFLQPYCEPGYRAIITDEKYKERSGNYLVDSVETTYGNGGARRKVGIAFKL